MSTNWKISNVSKKNETYTHIEAYAGSKGGTILKRLRSMQYLNIRVLYITRCIVKQLKHVSLFELNCVTCPY